MLQHVGWLQLPYLVFTNLQRIVAPWGVLRDVLDVSGTAAQEPFRGGLLAGG